MIIVFFGGAFLRLSARREYLGNDIFTIDKHWGKYTAFIVNNVFQGSALKLCRAEPSDWVASFA